MHTALDVRSEGAPRLLARREDLGPLGIVIDALRRRARIHEMDAREVGEMFVEHPDEADRVLEPVPPRHLEDDARVARDQQLAAGAPDATHRRA